MVERLSVRKWLPLDTADVLTSCETLVADWEKGLFIVGRPSEISDSSRSSSEHLGTYTFYDLVDWLQELFDSWTESSGTTRNAWEPLGASEVCWEPCGRLHYQNVAHYLHTALHNLALILLYMTHADVVAVLVLLSSTDCQTGMIDNTQWLAWVFRFL